VRLDQISETEQDILRGIIAASLDAPFSAVKAMARDLPHPLVSYTQAIGQLREQEYGIPGRSRHRQERVERRR
jgi:hypothetical protein